MTLKKYFFIAMFFMLSGVLNKIKAQDNKDSILSKVEIEASFPGGDAAWNNYIVKAFKDADLTFKKSDQGTCRIRFIVDKHGMVSNVEALNMKKTRLAKFAVEAIENGPKWKPAMQFGRPVIAYREQPITLTLEDAPKTKKEKD